MRQKSKKIMMIQSGTSIVRYVPSCKAKYVQNSLDIDQTALRVTLGSFRSQYAKFASLSVCLLLVVTFTMKATCFIKLLVMGPAMPNLSL